MGSALCTVLKAVISANGSFAGDIQIQPLHFHCKSSPPLPAPPRGRQRLLTAESQQSRWLCAPGTISACRGLDVSKGKVQRAAKSALRRKQSSCVQGVPGRKQGWGEHAQHIKAMGTGGQQELEEAQQKWRASPVCPAPTVVFAFLGFTAKESDFFVLP